MTRFFRVARTTPTIVAIHVCWLAVVFAASATGAEAVLHTVTAKTRVPVRAGGSDKFYITGYVNPGDEVVVLGKSAKYPGWLEIRPPAGSFSWINGLVVKRYGKFVGAVNSATPVPTRIGSQLWDTKKGIPPVENAKRLPRGTLLILLDSEPVVTDDGSWLQIAPTPGEVRYLPADAIKGSRGRPLTGDSESVRELIAKGDAAFRQQQWCLATRLYQQAANRSAAYQERLYCYRQLEKLTTLGGGPENCRSQPGHPQHPTTIAAAGQRPNARLPVAPSAKRTALSPVRGQWTAWGYLRRTSFTIQGRPAYVLVDKQGRPITYAITAPNLTLDPYLNRYISLFGDRGYHSDRYFRNHYLLVNRVAVP